ncbi:MAG: hypothetical protein GTO51_01845 [Candidatus Latescibacteria bacterium]|nr:hypothetical protein [Candidatus Latescibacterota bacterium]NIM22167.1 hypothetical protein [Candidatus Latescibacterota bacterium]NIM64717.1 hypothetical protein [Candidatus Latescibacterota bacterium]NIO01227.1 hypothetical protein [Candidatus Latescibacterota bacterium]NIO27612.1 hypothetical protein [Candidatus Latescibacterota bacterium]
MTDLRREIHLLISIAKLDASIAGYRTELKSLPDRIEEVEKAIAKLNKDEKEAIEHFETMKKERRRLERKLEDNGALIGKYKTQLMSVKTNKEYEAVLKEIAALEKGIDEKEEKLLILMDEIDEQERENKVFLEKAVRETSDLRRQKVEMEARVEFLKEELKKLRTEKPKFLEELGPKLQRQYGRIIEKLGDVAVTRIEGDVCQGCFATIPPQRVNEVKKNDRIITCEGCGRILVFYTS